MDTVVIIMSFVGLLIILRNFFLSLENSRKISNQVINLAGLFIFFVSNIISYVNEAQIFNQVMMIMWSVMILIYTKRLMETIEHERAK